jgi:hypothetical protein
MALEEEKKVPTLVWQALHVKNAPRQLEGERDPKSQDANWAGPK